jgi:alpha-D-xyloside xylohydrolase
MRYDDAAGILHIGERVGGFEGMSGERSIEVRWISGPDERVADFDAGPDVTLVYTGKPVTVSRR